MQRNNPFYSVTSKNTEWKTMLKGKYFNCAKYGYEHTKKEALNYAYKMANNINFKWYKKNIEYNEHGIYMIWYNKHKIAYVRCRYCDLS